jgi:hypothetical protein
MGARMTFHGADILNSELGADINVKQWDIYGTLSAGIVSKTWSVDSRYSAGRNFDSYIYPSIGLVLGAKYFTTQTFAIHGEIGKGPFGFLTFGVSYWMK